MSDCPIGRELGDELRELVEACPRKQPERWSGLGTITRPCRERSAGTSLKPSGRWLPAVQLAEARRRTGKSPSV